MNKFEKVLIYAKSKGQNELTCRELFDMQEEAFKLTPEQIGEVDKIIIKHGLTREEWNDVLDSARSFWFGGDELQNKINEEIMDYMKSIEMKFLANYSIGVFSGHLKNVVDKANSKISRRHDGKVFKYYLL